MARPGRAAHVPCRQANGGGGSGPPCGRGLLIAGRLVQAWAPAAPPGGKIVWAEVALEQAA
jgi:hypothetical protein